MFNCLNVSFCRGLLQLYESRPSNSFTGSLKCTSADALTFSVEIGTEDIKKAATSLAILRGIFSFVKEEELSKLRSVADLGAEVQDASIGVTVDKISGNDVILKIDFTGLLL